MYKKRHSKPANKHDAAELKKLTADPKFRKVMREKDLKSSSGDDVTNPKQRFAIALSEADRHGR
jgi:hypothetical protein